MAYIPKSKILFKTTSGDEFMYEKSKAPYIGEYMEFSNGDLRVGKNYTKPGKFLIPLKDNSSNRMGNTPDVKKYSNLKPPTKKSLSKYKQVPSSKPLPTEEDYKTGYFTRYIAKRVNQQFGFIEIDNKTYKSILNDKKEYDPNLYTVGILTWSLNENAHQTNNIQLQILERTLPFISTLFPNFSEYETNNIQNSEILESPTTNQSTPSPSPNNSGGNNNSGY